MEQTRANEFEYSSHFPAGSLSLKQRKNQRASGRNKKKLGWADYFSSRYEDEIQRKNEATLGTFNYMQSKDNRTGFQSREKTME